MGYIATQNSYYYWVPIRGGGGGVVLFSFKVLHLLARGYMGYICNIFYKKNKILGTENEGFTKDNLADVEDINL